MKKNEKYLIAAAAVLALLIIPKVLNPGNMTAAELIASFEGFRAHPYWDVSRYSWGYGTQAPGATGTITESQAMQELQAHSQDDYDYLVNLITRPLRSNQWTAYLSFAYQEGTGNADNLVDNINSGNDAALEQQWKLYNKVRDENGNLQYDAGTAARRAKEWKVWSA